MKKRIKKKKFCQVCGSSRIWRHGKNKHCFGCDDIQMDLQRHVMRELCKEIPLFKALMGNGILSPSWGNII